MNPEFKPLGRSKGRPSSRWNYSYIDPSPVRAELQVTNQENGSDSTIGSYSIAMSDQPCEELANDGVEMTFEALTTVYIYTIYS